MGDWMMEHNGLTFILIILLLPCIYWLLKVYYNSKLDKSKFKKNINNLTITIWLWIIILIYNLVNYSIFENNIKYETYEKEALIVFDYEYFSSNFDIDNIELLEKKCYMLEMSFCNIFQEYIILRKNYYNNELKQQYHTLNKYEKSTRDSKKTNLEMTIWSFRFKVESWVYWEIKKEKIFILGLSNIYKIFIR